MCTITGAKRYSADLKQGGMEIPCVLTFEGSIEDSKKAEKLVRRAYPVVEEDSKKTAQNEVTDTQENTQLPINSAIHTKHFCLERIEKNKKLTDLEVNHAQRLIKQQYPWLNGLQLTLLQEKPCPGQYSKDQVQIVHCKDADHWIVASTVGCEKEEVYVYDSAYMSLDESTTKLIANLFHCTNIRVMDSQKQKGAVDCGLFAIANITALAMRIDIAKCHFDQASMRKHLADCLLTGKMTMFPQQYLSSII